MREMTYAHAIRDAIREEMSRDKSVFVMGEDVRMSTWATDGLVKDFGKDRVRDTPISELGFVGSAVGAAMTGMRPVVEIMFDDLLPICSEQIVNQAARIRYMFAQNVSLPIVIRVPGGGGVSGAGHHSSSLDGWFMHVPGLKVAIPATPCDAKGLLKTAIRGDDPVVFKEHKALYGIKGDVPEGEFTIPFGEAKIRKEGDDVTIVATLLMVHKALKAAEKLAQEGISAEVIDPRTLVPLDELRIIDSVKKTGKLVVCHESWRRCGVGSEIACIVAEKALEYLDAPIRRVTTKDAPFPYSPALEQYILPNEEEIIRTVREIVR